MKISLSADVEVPEIKDIPPGHYTMRCIDTSDPKLHVWEVVGGPHAGKKLKFKPPWRIFNEHPRTSDHSRAGD